MSLKAIIDDLDSVEEQFRPLYEEMDGKFVLQIEGISVGTSCALNRNTRLFIVIGTETRIIH